MTRRIGSFPPPRDSVISLGRSSKMRASSSRGIDSLAIARFLITSTLLLVLVELDPAAVWAQLPQARLNTIYPLGGQRGTTVDLSLGGGVDLDEASQLYFSHPGITAVPKTA